MEKVDPYDKDPYKDLSNRLDDYIIHFKGEVDNLECNKRKILRCSACEICGKLYHLRYRSNHKDLFPDFPGIYQIEQEIEQYEKDNREHIKAHGIIKIS